jgi:hypothetical protein
MFQSTKDSTGLSFKVCSINRCTILVGFSQCFEPPTASPASAVAREVSVAAAGATGAAGDSVWSSVGTKDEAVDALENILLYTLFHGNAKRFFV